MTSQTKIWGEGKRMELSPKQQINELVKKSQTVLILSNSQLGGDSLGGVLALERVLTKLGKEVTVVSSSKIKQTLTFLPGIEKVKKDIDGTRDLIIQLDRNLFPVEKLSYNEAENFLNILITPKAGQIKPEEVKILQGDFKFDLIFILDTPDVDKLDTIYDRYTELFFETPIINIDHHAGNEYFGTINMVDVTATSTCEILVSVIESMGANYFDADVATCLLTGIVADTGSYKNINTTPKSLTISAQMLAAGARQQEIIQNLYKTRPLDTLKLWGKILSRLEHDKEHRFIYSFVTNEDFQNSNAQLEDIKNIMDELLSSTPGSDFVLLLTEYEPSKIAGKLKGTNGQDVLAFAEIFGGYGKAQSADFEINMPLEAAVSTITTKIRDLRATQLGRSTTTPEKSPEVPISKVPKTEPVTHNHLQKIELVNETKSVESENTLAQEIEKLNKKVEHNSEISAEAKELFDKFISTQIPVDNEKPLEEPKEIPPLDPIVQALESLEHEKPELELEPPKDFVDSQKTDAPNIDIKDNLSKEDTFQAIKDIIQGYKPGENLDEQK